MTAFVARDATHLGVDRIATSPTAFALYENLKAVLEKDATAVAAGWVLANSYVVEAMLASASVSQGKLKSTTGDVSSSANTTFTLPGGEYGCYPQVWHSGGGDHNAQIGMAISGGSPSTQMSVLISSGTAHARQRYIQASPPYDLGDGQVPLFVFVLVDASGRVLATYSAEDPPWANNGPTSIRPDFLGPDGKPYQMVRRRLVLGNLKDRGARDAELEKLYAEPEIVEVDQTLKNADMPLVPHPFMHNDLTGLAVVLLDPVSVLVERLHRLHLCGESVPEILHGEYLLVDNRPLARSAPPGVIAVAASWR